MLLMPEIKLFVLSSCFNGSDLFFAVRFQNQIAQDALILLDQGTVYECIYFPCMSVTLNVLFGVFNKTYINEYIK